jgi:hypothetical protein
MSDKHARERYALSDSEFEWYLRNYQLLNAIRWVEVFDESDAIKLWRLLQRYQPNIHCDDIIERIRYSDTLYTLLLELWIASANKNALKPIGDWFLEHIIEKRDTTQ